MSVTDPIADLLTRIRNAYGAMHSTVTNSADLSELIDPAWRDAHDFPAFDQAVRFLHQPSPETEQIGRAHV